MNLNILKLIQQLTQIFRIFLAVGMPDAFGSVHYFNEWIQSTIEDNEDN